MGNFMELVGFEFKKILWKKRSIYIMITFVLIIALMLIASVNGVGFYHKEERKISQYQAMKMDKDVILSNKGEITTNLVKEAVLSNQAMVKNDDNYLINKFGRHIKGDSYIKYILPYEAIVNLIDVIYEDEEQYLSKDGLSLINIKSENAIDTLAVENIVDFDADLKDFTKDMVMRNQGLTPKEIQKNVEMIEQMDLPLYNDYYGGYVGYINSAKELALVGFFFILIIVASIFSKEYEEKTSQIVLTTKNGKGSLCWAKLTVVFIVSLGSSVLVMGISWLLFLAVFGFEGAKVNIQLLDPSCTYNLNLLEACTIHFATVVLAEILFAMLITFFSAKTKKRTYSVIVKGVIITVVPMFIWVSLEDFRLLHNVLSFLPVNMVTFNYGMHFFEIFGNLIDRYKVFWGVSIGGVILLGNMAIASFRKHQENGN